MLYILNYVEYRLFLANAAHLYKMFR